MFSEFPAFYKTRTFIAVFTKFYDWILSRDRRINYLPSYIIPLRPVLIVGWLSIYTLVSKWTLSLELTSRAHICMHLSLLYSHHLTKTIFLKNVTWHQNLLRICPIRIYYLNKMSGFMRNGEKNKGFVSLQFHFTSRIFLS